MWRLFQSLFLLFITTAIISCGTDSSTPNPQVNGIQPESGPPGTMVTIFGSGFSTETSGNSVSFGGTSATVNSATETTIETEVPSGVGTGSVRVQVAVGEETTSGPGFTVEPEAPGISSVDPDSGTTGTAVTIKGMNFSAAASENTIEFNGVQATVDSASENELVTEVPAGATDGPVEVTVHQKTTAGPDFDVITEGTLEIDLTTSGTDKDSGYDLSVNGSSQEVAANETTTIPDLEEGFHEVGLAGISDNCDLSGDNPRLVEVSAGDTASTTFEVGCRQIAENRIVFHSNRDGDYEIFMMDPDGSNLLKLTDNFDDDMFPAFSNDGTRISFVSDRNGTESLLVMNVDGTNVRTVTSSSVSSFIYSPSVSSWSPDDSELVFVRGSETFKINTDGSGETSLGGRDAPSWSPGGDRIAYVESLELYTMNTEGNDTTLIAGFENGNPDSTFVPRWSPEGNKIAATMVVDGEEEIYTINPDGSGFQKVTDEAGSDERYPSFSPDASELVIQSDNFGSDNEIYILNADGSGFLKSITSNGADDGAPDWSPVE